MQSSYYGDNFSFKLLKIYICVSNSFTYSPAQLIVQIFFRV